VVAEIRPRSPKSWLPLIWRGRDRAFWGMVVDLYPSERLRHIACYREQGYRLGPEFNSSDAGEAWLIKRLKYLTKTARGAKAHRKHITTKNHETNHYQQCPPQG
jgi:hypothetical protein